MNPTDSTSAVNEDATPWRGASWQDASDDALLAGARMSFRERIEWNAQMISLWAKWHPELARRVFEGRESLR